jgi:hypothetical protein
MEPGVGVVLVSVVWLVTKVCIAITKVVQCWYGCQRKINVKQFNFSKIMLVEELIEILEKMPKKVEVGICDLRMCEDAFGISDVTYNEDTNEVEIEF